MHFTSCPFPILSPSYRPISKLYFTVHIIGSGYSCTPSHTGPLQELLVTFFYWTRQLLSTAKLLTALPVFCLSVLKSIPRSALFCTARTTFPSLLCSPSYHCVWLMGGTGRRLVLGGEGKPGYLSPYLCIWWVFSSSCIYSLILATSEQSNHEPMPSRGLQFLDCGNTTSSLCPSGQVAASCSS